MTTIITHDDKEFRIRVTSFPDAHIATISSTDPTIDYRVTLWRSWPSVRLATDHAIAYITTTFPTDATT